jgi:hypothetical protein
MGGDMGVMRSSYKILIRIERRRSHVEDRCVDGRIILKWILKEEDLKVDQSAAQDKG